MRPVFLLYVILAAAGAQASWFSSDPPPYDGWNTAELTAWLQAHNIQVPSHPSASDLQALVKDNWNTASTWSEDQYAKAQVAFSDLRESVFDTWDDSRLREFLLEQGVIQPSGSTEQLRLLAKQKYRAYTNAASSFSASATSLASGASAAVSTAVYGDSTYQASKSLSSIIAQATKSTMKPIDYSKDYIYSTWDDNKLKDYLVSKGALKGNSQKKRDEMLNMMSVWYAGVANPVWQAWSDSYIRNWLVHHGILKSDAELNRDKMVKQMTTYYYDVNDTVYSTWSNSALKAWLTQRGIVKSDAELKRDELLKLVKDNYTSAVEVVWGAWYDSDMRAWLIENGYMKSDAQAKRDELIAMMQSHYNDVTGKAAPYLVWPDARLRAYLREHGVDDQYLPVSRPGLLQETRIRWVMATHHAESLFDKIREVVNGGVQTAEDSISKIMDILGGASHAASEKAHKASSSITSAATTFTDAAASKAAASSAFASSKKASISESLASKSSASVSSARESISKSLASQSSKAAASASSASAKVAKSASSLSSKAAGATDAAKDRIKEEL